MAKQETKINLLKKTYQKPFEWFKEFRCALGTLIMFLLTALFFIYIIFIYTLPNLEHVNFDQIKKKSENLIKSRLVEKTNYFRWTPISKVNRDYLYAIVLAEDSRFFEHHGINYDAIADAMAKNYKTSSYNFGASTISQQVVKNLYLNSSKSLFRKAQEYFLTKELEKKFTKNQILELYLNIAEFGGDVIGIRAASFRIFKKSPKNINAAEGALISVLLPSPRRYYYSMIQNHNITNTQKRKIKRILSDMRHLNYISYSQYLNYINYKYF